MNGNLHKLFTNIITEHDPKTSDQPGGGEGVGGGGDRIHEV